MVPKFKIMEKNMKKRTLIEIILGNVGGLLLAIGMCMIFIPNWNLSATGVALTIFGGINLLAIIPIHIKGPHKSRIYNWKRIILKIIVITIALIIGYGIGEIIARKNMILGVVIWVIGLMISILSYPTYEYYKVDKKKLLKTALGTIGSIMLAVGMSMTFIRYWNLTLYGTIIGLIGAALLVFFVYLNKKNNEEFYYIDLRFITLIIVELIGGFLTVFGIVKVCSADLNQDNSISTIIIGLITCSIGFLICALNIPEYIYLKTNNLFNKKIKINLKNKENNYSLSNLVILFFIYGFIGWIIESTFFGITNGKFINRGFLHLPILPIYGFGGVAVTFIFSKNQKMVFIKSSLIVSVLEYLTSFVLEKVFNLRWWDYKNNPLNINGRICLLNCLLFGLGGYVIAKFISPYLNIKLNQSNKKVINIINVIFSIITLTDFIYTIFHPNIGIGVTI